MRKMAKSLEDVEMIGDARSKNNGETTGVCGAKLVWFCYDHGLYYYLYIVDTSNKKDRQLNCTNGQALAGQSSIGEMKY
jgi:hypothetical protein